jgi:5-formyltetrahydrofolate cyclo-ligase
VQVRPERKALPTDCPPHLLLRFESNGSHRHLRVAPLSSSSRLNTETPSLVSDRRALRRELRARRRAITGTARTLAGRQLAHRIDMARWLKPGRRIGLYLAMDEELDTAPLLRLARQRGCVIAVPRIVSKRHSRMAFFEFNGHAGKGAYGILEPDTTRAISSRELDMVFMPLVGFDAAGNRIGMGKGYYDRCFAHRIRQRQWRRPLLVGIAYDVQQVATLPSAWHDVPLDLIVTESTIHRPPGKES